MGRTLYINTEGMGRNTKIYTKIMGKNNEIETTVIHLHLSNMKTEAKRFARENGKINIRPCDSEHEILNKFFDFLAKMVKSGMAIVSGKDIPLLAIRQKELEDLQ